HPCVLVVLVTLLLPQPPPLFPYTTLFRSIPSCRCGRWRSKNGALPRSSKTLWISNMSGNLQKSWKRTFVRHAANLWKATGDFAGDRKSTRLNSSHVSISYAVFCLKKKKRQ